MKISTLTILKTLANNYPDTTVFRKNIIESTARDLGYTGKDFVPLLTPEARVHKGTYDLASIIPKPEPVVEVVEKVIEVPAKGVIAKIFSGIFG